MSREGYQLKDWAAADRESFRDDYGSEGNCSCFLNPPCGCCTHPGNPRNQEEDDECWELEGPGEEDGRWAAGYKERSTGTGIVHDGAHAYRIVLGPGGWAIVHRSISRKRKNEILSGISRESSQRISKVRREFIFISLKD